MSPEAWLRSTILGADSWDKGDVLGVLMSEYGMSERDASLAVWRVREAVRTEDGVVFVRLRGVACVYVRADAKGIASQASRQRAAGGRKIARAAEKLSLAASLAQSQDERERLELAACRIREREALWGKR